MLAFYCITIFGAFFVSVVIAELGRLGPLLQGTIILLEEVIDRSMVFAVIGLASLSSILTGYFSMGPASLLIETDEYVLMPSPVKPFQVFFAKYMHRVIRKFFIIIIIFIALFPILNSLDFFAVPIVVLILSFITLSEINFLLSGITAYIRMEFERRTKSLLRHFMLVILAIVIYLPTTAEISIHPISHVFVPSNAVAMILIETTGILSYGYQIEVGILCLVYTFMIFLLLLANFCNYDFYDEFSKVTGKAEAEGTFSKMIRGEVEFSDSRFEDPVVWIMLKDFWGKMRTPMQFWKYVYVLLGTVFALYLNIAQPVWLPPFIIPPELSSAAVPAFLLMLLLLTQMTAITSLLAFVEEKENVYLLKVSPFRDRDIILGKYILSVIEISLSALPVYGLVVYFFTIRGAALLVSIAAPLILVFSASGIMVGAYIPVFTNDPRTPPVPLAFAFPAINLAIGGLLVGVISRFAQDPYLLIILPGIIVGIVTTFLGLAVVALGHYR
jgi:hypothetical protein